MGLGAVLGAGESAFCSRLGTARRAFWSRFGAARKTVWRGAGTSCCASPLPIRSNLFIYYIRRSPVTALSPFKSDLNSGVGGDQITGLVSCPVDGSSQMKLSNYLATKANRISKRGQSVQRPVCWIYSATLAKMVG